MMSPLAAPGVAQAQEPDDAQCPNPVPTEAATEFEAAVLAELCGVPIEVVGDRTAWGESIVHPDQTVTVSSSIEPVRAQDETGTWAPIDTTLEFGSDGLVRPANAVGDIVFSGGGSSPLASLGSGDQAFALTWLSELPEPVLAGESATYPEVFAGVDLVVTASAEGFSHDLVVKTAEAAQTPALEAVEFGIEASGLSAVVNEAGGIALVEAESGAEFGGAAPPQMWDSSADSEAAGANTLSASGFSAASVSDAVPVGVEVEGSVLRLLPDAAMLDSAETVFPVTIDPMWTMATNGWRTVSSLFPSNSYWNSSHLTNTEADGDAGVGRSCQYSWTSAGHCTSSDQEYVMRSLFRFDLSGVTQDSYRIARSAKVYFMQRESAFCDEGAMNLYQASAFSSSSGDTWNDQPTAFASTLRTTNSANNGRTCGGSGNVAFTVTDLVDAADNAGSQYLYLTLRAPDESPSPDLRYWNRFDGAESKIELTFDVLPYIPRKLEIAGKECTDSTSSPTWINLRSPVLSAVIDSKDSMVKWQARVRESGTGGAVDFEWTSGELEATGARRSKGVTSSLPDDSYFWLARAISTSNAAIASEWSVDCRFNVDGTKPSTPTVTPATGGPYSVGEDLQFTLKSSDPTVNGIASGIDGFEYWWQSDPTVRWEDSTGTATINTADVPGMEDGLTAGRHVLYVRALDKAGNKSYERTYTFFAGNDIPATPKAAWRFEGDAFDDTGHGNDLDLAKGDAISYTSDRDNRPGAALALDGSTCLSTGAPVVRTDAAYSIAAWVRLDAAEGYDKALVQAGDAHSAFQIQYDAAGRLWNFSVLDANYTWYSLGAAPTVGLGEWEHIAATYDPDAGLTRLYLGGELVGEKAVNFEPWDGDANFGLGCLITAEGATSHYVTGAIDQVGLWQGLLSESQIQAMMHDLPGAREQAHWSFRDGGKDTSAYGRDLEIPPTVTVGQDAFERPSGAVELDGTTCLEHSEPVTATDRSFTVAAWAKLDATTGNTTLVSTAGESTTAMRLRYSAAAGKWVFMVTDQDSAAAAWPQVQSLATVEADRWYHLTGIYDDTKRELRFYVDGQSQGTRTGVTTAWNATGPTLIGCAGRENDGYRWEHLNGALHDVRLWRGTVDATQIAEMMGDPPADGVAWWDLDENGNDWIDGGHHLNLVPNYSWVRGEDGTRDGALAIALNGGGYGHTAGPVVTTDESFTIGAWVKLDSLAADQVAVSITGASRGVIDLKYSHASGSWAFSAPPDGTHGWRIAEGAPAPVAGVWTHLVGVYDLRRGELRLYVNGTLAGTATGVVMPASTGPVVIGAERNADGTIRDGLVGAVDRVQIWQGALPAGTIAAAHLAPEVL